MISFLQKLDLDWFLYLNSLNSPFFDKIMWFISGKFEWVPLYLLLIFWIFYRFRKRGWIILALTLVVFALCDAGSVHLFKNVFLRLRPSRDPELQGLVHIVNGYRGGLYGFISAHAANTFGLAVFMSLVFRDKWFVFSILTWAAVTSYSRIYLGVHYPFDVITGALWGSLMAIAVFLVYYRFRKRVINSEIPVNDKIFFS
jgi:undecaprenyl-diphosphatase